MFDKILIEDGKIRFAQWSVAWKEKRTFKAPDGDKETLLPHSEWGVGEARKDELINFLTALGIEYTVNPLSIPAEFQQFEGKEWFSGRGEAIKLINEDPEYIIGELKKQLAAEDYKHVRQQREREILAKRGDFELTVSEPDYVVFCLEQDKTVQKIREMEGKLAERLA